MSHELADQIRNGIAGVEFFIILLLLMVFVPPQNERASNAAEKENDWQGTIVGNDAAQK
ncbi:MAG: hypothetical protein JWN50_319 [Parcubacteria group bacterium]|nr:hypothetical protein [Parcubacteria group bacterium]